MVKVLWLCSTPVKAVTDSLGLPPAVYGGWMNGAFNDMMGQDNIELVISYPQNRFSRVELSKGSRFSAYGFPWNKSKFLERNLKIHFRNLLESERPDCIHLFGTEQRYHEIMVDLVEEMGLSDRIVVSIQGLVAECAKHFLTDLPRKVLKRRTLSELKNRCSLDNQRDAYAIRGRGERRIIAKAPYAIGRTTWDKACCFLINPKIKYRHVGESLREEFYEASIAYAPESHALYFSQGAKPIKALHRLIEAIPMVKEHYPDIKVYVSGLSGLRVGLLRGCTYDRYLMSRMRDLGVESSFEFVGILNAEEIISLMSHCSAFVSTSSLENSPNSMGEAMMVGLPCVSSCVGGVPDMASHGSEALLYPLDDTNLLAYYIIWLFDHPEEASRIGLSARNRARKNHDRDINALRLMSVYHEIGDR